jgi:large subunit ribosomal protein L24
MVSVFLSGPIADPKRTVDVSALTAWLTLRAVEQQSKQLEAMEAKRRAAAREQPPEEPRTTSVTPQSVPSMVVSPAAAPPILAPALPPAIEIPSLPNIVGQKPARAPARTQRGIAAQPRPVPAKPLQILPTGPDN